MKNTKLWHKSTVAVISALLLSSGPMPSFSQDCDHRVMARNDLAHGCAQGGWTVTCAMRGEVCVVTASICYEYTTSDYCGDECVFEQGCGTYCVPMGTVQVAVTGDYGTPACNNYCGGQCINRTPYPAGTTAEYPIFFDEPCSGG